ncbi:MAG: hypothetical protein E6G56_14675 [Actinobacteria bacterium]|nr:MAG: hypothetical protein E6G56_14675 [Actinomycetota bacterium]
MLSYSNVMSTLALFVALGGASYAAVTLPPNSVGSRQVRNGSLGQRKLARRHQTIEVFNKPTSARVVDNSPAGDSQGDMLVSVSDALDRSGHRVGQNQGYCVEVKPGGFGAQLGTGSATCTEVFALGRGEIHVVGTTGAGSGVGVVVGGTGAYAGATGTVTPGKRPVNGTFADTLRITVPR